MTLIIAEAGVNHNGNTDLAFKLVDAAKASGADVIKFQTFKSKKLASDHATLAPYQKKNLENQISQRSMLQALELPFSVFRDLKNYANKIGIEFLSTAFDDDSLHFLVNQLSMKRLKIPSGELTNSPLVLEHAKTKSNIILSTGMATLSDIETALSVIAFGLIESKDTPSISSFHNAYMSPEGQIALRSKVTLLQCTTEYPAPPSSLNLRAIKTLKSTFNLPVGFSDHSIGSFGSIAAVALGARIIEKHFTIDRELPGPDHHASLEPKELKDFVAQIRSLDDALGSGVKFPNSSEMSNILAARKCLIVNSNLKKGELITENILTTSRSGVGMPPIKYWDMIGKIAKKNYNIGDPLDE